MKRKTEHFHIEKGEAVTICEAPHPVRTGKHEGYYCRGDEEHYYPVWVVIKTDQDTPLDADYDRYVDAVNAMEVAERNLVGPT
jgi:hypothetical protein